MTDDFDDLEKKRISKKNMTKWIMRKTTDMIMTAMNPRN